MSDAAMLAVVIAFIAVMPGTLIAVATLITSIKNGKKADDMRDKVIEIHTQTNGNLSKLTSALELANTKIVGLEKLVTEMNNAKHEAKQLADKGQQ